jgi:membrane-bound lytic murein transglycosylase D
LPETTKSYTIRIPLIAKDNLQLNRLAILDSASKVGKKELELLARNTEGSTYGRDRIIYRVKNGDVLGKIAIRHNVRVADIKKWNNLNSNTIQVGQRLNIWLRQPTRTEVAMANPTTTPSKPIVVSAIPDSKMYVVQPGDTLWDISRKFEGLTIDKLKQLNNLANTKIHAGQKLIIAL